MLSSLPKLSGLKVPWGLQNSNYWLSTYSLILLEIREKQAGLNPLYVNSARNSARTGSTVEWGPEILQTLHEQQCLY